MIAQDLEPPARKRATLNANQPLTFAIDGCTQKSGGITPMMVRPQAASHPGIVLPTTFGSPLK